MRRLTCGVALAALALASATTVAAAGDADAADTPETMPASMPATGAPATAPATALPKPLHLPPRLAPLGTGKSTKPRPDEARVIDEFKLSGKGPAGKAKVQFFELHGYLRWRTDLFQNLDLRSNALESDGNWTWRDQNLDFGNVGIGVIRPLTEVPPNNTCIYTPLAAGRMCNPSASGGGAETLAGSNMRLRLDPTINVSEFLRIKATIDLLDNIVMGSTPHGFGIFAGRPADVPILAFSDGSVPPDSRNSFSDSVRVKRAWAEVRTPFGELRFGRMPSHWGLGVLANDGNDLDDDYGDTADRILFATKIANHIIAPAYDIPVSGFISSRARDYSGQPYDLDQLDDVNQWILVIARRDTPAELEKMRLRGDISFNYGAYLVFRTQSFSGAENIDSFEPNPESYELELVNARAFIPDIWLRLVWGKLHLEIEAVGIFGTIEFNPINAGVPCGNPDPTAPESCSILQFGGAFHASYSLLEDKLSIRLRTGFASGDQAEGLTTEGGLPPQPAGDNRLTAFRFDRAYYIDMILFRQILGTITGVSYFNLGATYVPGKPVEGLSASLDAIYSVVNEPTAAPGNNFSLGLEFNAEVAYETKDGFYGHVQGGLLIPFRALEFPHAIYGFRPDGEDVKAKVAFTIQGFLGIKF